MANLEFTTLTILDDPLIAAFRSLCASLGLEDAQLAVSLGQQAKNFKLSKVNEDEQFSAVLRLGSTAIRNCTVFIPINKQENASVRVIRGDGFDKVLVAVPDTAAASFEISAPLIIAVRKAFQPFERTGLIQRELSPALADFYEKREAGLLRLEALTQKMLEDNQTYRAQVDLELHAERKRLAAETEERKRALDAEYKAKQQELQEREAELEKRKQELDDHDNTHARRKLRNDLKQSLKERNTCFALTTATARKRWSIHFLFTALIVATGIALALAVQNAATAAHGTDQWFAIARLAVSMAGFVAATIFYIRWQDRWSQAHADEEFRLKRLDLDVDRASWLVETMLEWKEEKGSEVPAQLVDRLSYSLFADGRQQPPVRHPAEDVLALLAASAGIKLNVPSLGGAEVNIDRKGLERLQDAAVGGRR